VKYYSNMRGFYEIESMLHSIQRATAPAESEPKHEKPKPKENNKTSSRPNAGQDGKARTTTRTGTTRKMQPSRWWHSLKVPSLRPLEPRAKIRSSGPMPLGLTRQGEKHELRKS